MLWSRAKMIEIVNPAGVSQAKRSALAARKADRLTGLRVGLLDNNKPNADKFLDFVGALLQERHGDVSLVRQRKSTRTEADGLAQLAGGADVVINAFAD
jgi:hypothetical protein